MLIVARLLSCRSFVNSTPFQMFNKADTGTGLEAAPPPLGEQPRKGLLILQNWSNLLQLPPKPQPRDLFRAAVILK